MVVGCQRYRIQLLPGNRGVSDGSKRLEYGIRRFSAFRFIMEVKEFLDIRGSWNRRALLTLPIHQAAQGLLCPLSGEIASETDRRRRRLILSPMVPQHGG